MPVAAKAQPATFDRASQRRRAMLGKVHIAKKQLSLSEDDYRQIIMDESGKMSAADLTDAQLHRVLGRFERQGFKPLAKSGGKRVAMHPVARKARALWISLHQLGVVHNPSEKALEAFAKRQLKCETLVWARQSHGYRLIEALKAMAEREGWSQRAEDGSALSPLQLREGLCLAILHRLRDAKGADQSWTLNDAAWRLCGIDWRTEGYSPPIEEYARVAEALGEKLRAIVPAGGDIR